MTLTELIAKLTTLKELLGEDYDPEVVCGQFELPIRGPVLLNSDPEKEITLWVWADSDYHKLSSGAPPPAPSTPSVPQPNFQPTDKEWQSEKALVSDWLNNNGNEPTKVKLILENGDTIEAVTQSYPGFINSDAVISVVGHGKQLLRRITAREDKQA